jgi:hypothetical protein
VLASRLSLRNIGTMPELPEVETVANGVHQRIAGTASRRQG